MIYLGRLDSGERCSAVGCGVAPRPILLGVRLSRRCDGRRVSWLRQLLAEPAAVTEPRRNRVRIAISRRFQTRHAEIFAQAFGRKCERERALIDQMLVEAQGSLFCHSRSTRSRTAERGGLAADAPSIDAMVATGALLPPGASELCLYSRLPRGHATENACKWLACSPQGRPLLQRCRSLNSAQARRRLVVTCSRSTTISRSRNAVYGS